MKKLILSLLAFTFSLLTCEAQSWLWGRDGTGSIKAQESGGYVATDKKGNAYIAGDYTSIITFSPFTLLGDNDNLYVAKYNATGAVQWAVQPGFSSDFAPLCDPLALISDNNGNLYVTGYFSDTATFGTTKLSTNYDYYYTYLAKYNSSGNVLWAIQANQINPSFIGCTNDGFSLAMDKNGNVYLSGGFNDTIAFGKDTLKGSDYNYNGYVVKLDSNGKVIWAEQGTVPSPASTGSGFVAADNHNHFYLGGGFIDTITYGAFTLKSAYKVYNVLLVKFDSAGKALWARQSTVPSSSSKGYVTSMISDNTGNVYLVGNFKDTLSFGLKTLITKDSALFMVKYDSNGTLVWAKQATNGSGYWTSSSMVKDDSDHIYFTGIGGKDSFDFGGLKLTSASPFPAFIMKIDTSGKAICGSMLYDGGGEDYVPPPVPVSCATDPTGQFVYVSGIIANDSVICGPDTLMAKGGGRDPYLARWQPCSFSEEGVNEVKTNSEEVIVYPNPSNGVFTVAIKNYQSTWPVDRLKIKNLVEVYNMLGEKVLTASLNPSEGGTSNTIITLPFGEGQGGAGIYLYRVISENGELIGTGKLIKE